VIRPELVKAGVSRIWFRSDRGSEWRSLEFRIEGSTNMQSEMTLLHGVMEGKGSYNRHAKLPGGGAALAVTFLEEAAQKAALDRDNGPVVIADYGSSQGKNSLIPMQIAIAAVRSRVGKDRAVFVFHIDQPSNDFNSLFEVLSSDPDRYAVNDCNVFPCAIGKSFYQQVLPAESVHLAWSSYAAVWLTCVPSLIPGHFMPVRATGAVRSAWRQQAAADWELFLSLRARELRPGGRLVVVLPARSEDGPTGFESIMDHANAALGEMAADREIGPEEHERMIVATYPRQKSELLAPFLLNEKFQDLTVEHCEVLSLPDGAWPDYERDGNAKALATRHALFFRAIFTPSLACALSKVREGDAEALNTFADRLQARMTRRLAAEPTPLHSLVEVMVLAKCD
jgi:SAM dependent carboxyl methyltransferase